MKKKLTKTIIFIATILHTTSSFAWTSPTLVFPANSASQWTAIKLNWNAVNNSEHYQLQVDTSSAFNSPLLINIIKDYINTANENTDTEHYLEDLFFGKTYYWRVRAYVPGDTSAWSQRTFITKDYVTLSSPTSGSTTYTSMTLNWAAHPGVDFYDMQADTSAAFNSPVLFTVSKAYVNTSDLNMDTEHYLENLFFGKTYYWRVRARNAVDTSLWTQRTFITTDFVNLSSPTSGSTAYTALTLNWAAHPGVDFYDMQTDTSASFNSPVLFTVSKAYINTSDLNMDTEHYLENLFFGKTYYWRVRTRNAVDTSLWTQRTFITTDFVNLSSPTSGSTTFTALTLNWAAHPGVDFYDMQADTSAAFNSPVLFTVSKAYINTSDLNMDTEHYLENLFFGKTYYWRVRARNIVDTSLWTQRTFITKDFVTMISPVNNAVNINVAGITLDWAAHEGVDAYQLQMDTTNTFTSSLLIAINKTYINSSSGNSDTETQTGSLLTNQVYFWRVRAINAVDTSLWITYVFSTGSVITGINTESVNDGDISISPNPVISNLTLVTKQTFNNSTIIIYNSEGQKINEKKEISGNIFDFNVSEYKPGLYFIEIIEKDKKVTKRFVKN